MLGVFAGITTAGVAAAVGVFAFLYRLADRGEISVEAAVALLLALYLGLSVLGIVAFLRLAIPPVTAQTRALEETLARQIEVNRRQTDFLVHLHHELRTPVTVVLGTTTLLASRGDDLPALQRNELREAAARNARVLGRLVEDLTLGVDEALPGLAAGVNADNWSSPRRDG